jgi:prolyl 4-hydroxylase
MLQDMLVVWDKEDALMALFEGTTILGEKLPETKGRPLVAEQNYIDVDGQKVEVLCRLNRPNAALLSNVFSEEECAELIQYATSKGLKNSGVVDAETGKSIDHEARTSTSVCMTRFETPLVEKLEKRLAELTGWPVENGEGLQILRYEIGQQYKPHFDWFDPKKVGGVAHLARGGQRVATTVVYLSIPEDGGGTKFSEVGLEVNPRVGGAIFFNDVDEFGEPEKISLHSGTPVIKGYKIVATYWQRERPFK